MTGKWVLLAMIASSAVGTSATAASQSVRTGVEAWQRGDHAAAVSTWTPLAARGDADAAFNLGQAYRLGKGVPTDLARSQQYLEQAARKGHVDAAANLGILLFQNGNRIGGLRWLRTAADGGEVRSMMLYGVALYNGDGIASDPIAAYAYVSRAAAQGLAIARTTLAEMDEAMPLEQRVKGLARAKAMAGGTATASAKTAVAAPAKALPRPIPRAPATVATSAASVAGNWRIQLGAFGQRSGAEAMFGQIRGKVGGRQAYYVPAGKVIRLQVGPYASRAAATAACAGLGACFAVAAR